MSEQISYSPPPERVQNFTPTEAENDSPQDEITIPNLCDMCPPGQSDRYLVAAAADGAGRADGADGAGRADGARRGDGADGAGRADGARRGDGGDGAADRSDGAGTLRAGEAGDPRNGAAFKPVELTAEDFDKLGPKAKEALLEKGITKITISQGPDGYDHIEMELKDNIVLPGDYKPGSGERPANGDVKELKLGKKVSFDVAENEDGSISVENVEGVNPVTWRFGKWREAKMDSAHVSQTEDGKTLITSTGRMGAFPGKGKPRVEGPEVLEKAQIMVERLKALREGSANGGGNSGMQTGYIRIPSILTLLPA